MKGRLIVIEGLDGSGKHTQAMRLRDILAARGMKVEMLSYPDYESESSGPVKMYLAGKFGSHPDDVDCYAASVLYAVDRFASYRAKWKKDYEEGTWFICDRYTTSNEVFQTSKLPKEKWDGYIRWVEDFEYRLMGIPRPDTVFFLNMSEECSGKLMEKRYSGDESRKDIHEKDVGYQKRSREAALYCAQHLGWIDIKCDDENGDILPVETISERMIAAVDATAANL